MKYLMSYKIFEADETYMYDPKIEYMLPKYIKVIDGDPKNPKRLVYKKGISRHLGPQIQIPYETCDTRGGREYPDTLEFDIYWSYDTNSKSLNINVEVNFGNLTASQFSIDSPNKVDVIIYTSLNSKDDPSNTIFAIDDESIQSLCNYFNRWDPSFGLKPEDLKFLDQNSNYIPS
jgi:hypothetical protein